jgi:hypothetical protein
VGRAGRGDVEIAGEFRHLPHQRHEAIVSAAGGTRLALVLDRPAHLVAARQSIDVAAVVGHKSELKPGVHVAIIRAMKKPDGSLETNRVNVGRGGVVPQ